MKKHAFVALIISLIFTTQSAFAFKLHNPFSKKAKQEAEKMVQTKDEWEEKAKNVNIEDRKAQPYQRPQDKDFKPKAPPSVKFVKYNVIAGEREVNLSKIKEKLDIKSQGVFDRHLKYMAYGQYYYSPIYNQISSEICIQVLKSNISRIKKALSANVINTKSVLAISSGNKELKKDFFSALTIVDFSPDSSKLLVKEKIGSSNEGIYRNYVWIYYLQGDKSQWFAIRFNNLNETIKKHHAKTGLALDNYRWDVKPLGFSKDQPETVITEAFAWDKNKKQVFLGLWGINSVNGNIKLISAKPMPVEISASAVIIKEFLP